MLSCGAWTSATPRALTTGGSTIGCSVPVIIIIIIITIVIIIVAIIVVVNCRRDHCHVVIAIIIINQTMQCTLLPQCIYTLHSSQWMLALALAILAVSTICHMIWGVATFIFIQNIRLD